MPFKIDGTLYPDTEPPTELNNLSEQVDFLARLCAAWDFGLLPNAETVAEIRQPGWCPAVPPLAPLARPAVVALSRTGTGLHP
jgi:hypothetical protein